MSLSVNVNTHHIEVSRGDDAGISYTVENSSGVAYDVSANSFAFTVKQYLDDSIGSAKFQKQSPAANGIDLTAAAAGTVVVNIASTDTPALAGPYVYDLEMTQGGKVYTIDQGIFFVKKDVTTPGVAGQPTGAIQNFPTNILSIGGVFYLRDVTTNLWWGFRVNSGSLEMSSSGSVSIPFTF
jgi:hypothetical protein